MTHIEEQTALDAVSAMVYDHARRKTWQHKDEHYWLSRLIEEIGELAQALNGRHEDPVELELTEIASIATSWLALRARRAEPGMAQCENCG